MKNEDLIIKSNEIEQQLKEINESISWNKNFGKKTNKIILALFIISLLMIIPFRYYYASFVPVSTTLAPTFMALSITGSIGVVASVGLAVLVKSLLALNKNYLSSLKEELVKEKIETTKLIVKNNLNNKKKQLPQSQLTKVVSKTPDYSYKYNSINKVTSSNDPVKKVSTTGYVRKKINRIHEKKNSK